MTEPLLRAALLVQQQRWNLAEGELRRVLADDSQSADAHRLLATCLLGQEKLDEAETEAGAAIHLEPDNPLCHTMLGWVLFTRNRYGEAGVAAQEAIRLDPASVNAFELLSRVCLVRERWQDALAAADKALAIDPEETDCQNLRAMALIKLGRRAEAGQTIGDALTRRPDDSLTHANQGWTLLQEGDPRQAMHHFRESLRLDPNQDWARAGMIEALKAKNIIYRWLLRYFFFMARLTTRTQWMLVIGLYVGIQIANGAAKNNPAIAPYINPLLFAYGAFVLLSWLGSSLCDLLLFFDKFARISLSFEQKLGAVIVGTILVVAASICVAGLILNDRTLLKGALHAGLVSVPASAIGRCSAGWPRWAMLGATLALACLASVPTVVDVLARFESIDIDTIKYAMSLNTKYFLGAFVGSQLLANGLANVVVER